MRVHLPLEALTVDLVPALAPDVCGEVFWETVRVVELEDGLAGQRAALPKLADRVVEQAHALRQRLREALLLLAQHLLDMAALLAEDRVRAAHLLLDVFHELVEERLLDAELVAMADRAPDDAPQHVAATLVAGHDAVGDQERARADVICDHTQRLIA